VISSVLRKGWKRFVPLLVVVSSCGVSLAQNLAQNPGFETGNTSGWTKMGAVTISAQSAEVHSGNYAALVQGRTATWNGIAQSLLGVVQPGQPYNISVWVRLVSGSATCRLTIKKTEGTTTTYANVNTTTASSANWTQLSGQYTLTASGTVTDLTLYIEPQDATSSYYADDLLVQSQGGGAGSPGTGGETAIFWDDLRQRIDGFGASSAWRGQWTSTQADMFFSTNNGTGTAKNGTKFPFTGVGLSLLRSRIVPGGTTVEQTIMQMAQARGAQVWSAPWSPATIFKSNTNVNGGSFVGNAANYQAYANQLAGYVARMKSQYGVNLYALSVQNEPDADVTTYESCNWTAQQIHDFIPYLAGALSASNVAGTKIMLPESQNWTDPRGLRSTTLNDAAVASMVSIIANHNYVPDNAKGDQSAPAALQTYGKALWQTEVAKLSGNDSSIEDAIYWAGRVHQFLTLAQANAWHYWWLCAHGTGNQGLCDTNDVPAKRMYTLGNFCRFVRPGFHRISTTNSGTSQISAYKNLTNGGFAIVVVNASTNTFAQRFEFAGCGVDSVTPWITSAALSLAQQPDVAVTNAAFTYDIPAASVVTFTGTASTNLPPALAEIADVTAQAGMRLAITNLASDPNLPGQALSFTLLSGPSNATLNSSTGVLEWRPLVSQADSTNIVRVKVQDDGTPVLSATNEYSIVVLPIFAPSMGSFRWEGSGLSLPVTGPIGPDYTLYISTNLSVWELYATTNPLSMPFEFSETNSTAPGRFFRIQIGP
jgi:glucuronoarabinoxylan endo-1,4-beta-xylanase